MNKGALLKLALFFSLAMNLSVLGVAGFNHFWHRDSKGAGETCVNSSADLNLSPEQETEYLRLRADFHAYRSTCHRRMMKLQQELLSELVADQPSQTRIAEILAQMSAQQVGLQERLIEHLLAEKAVLRTDQHSVFEVILRRHVLKSRAEDCFGNEDGAH